MRIGYWWLQPLSTLKSRYPFSNANPNRIMQSMIAVFAGLEVPFVCTENHELAEETIASYLYQIYTKSTCIIGSNRTDTDDISARTISNVAGRAFSRLFLPA